jgi:hypothetical protein
MKIFSVTQPTLGRHGELTVRFFRFRIGEIIISANEK